MEIIDRTPFLSESGEISVFDQLKAVLKYGDDWFEEVKAQKTVITCFTNALDNSFTLLRNISLAGLGVTIPLILVGPAGVYVLYVTPLRGMYRARGDEWGTLEGYKFKPARVNLIARTEHMGRAVQTYLERQGYPATTPVDAVLLAADPGLHIDSVRPVIRVVMRDALEHFAVSLVQGHTLFSAESVHDIVNRIANPSAPVPEAPPPPAAPDGAVAPFGQPADAFFMDSTHDLPAAQPPEGSAHFPASGAFAESLASLQPEVVARPKIFAFSVRQWAFLIAFFVIEIIALIIFIVLVMSNI
jgi:hypothetical protein